MIARRKLFIRTLLLLLYQRLARALGRDLNLGAPTSRDDRCRPKSSCYVYISSANLINCPLPLLLLLLLLLIIILILILPATSGFEQLNRRFFRLAKVRLENKQNAANELYGRIPEGISPAPLFGGSYLD